MAANPQMLIRIAATIEDLKRNLAEGKSQIETTTNAMQKLATSLDGSRLEQRAHNVVAAVNSIGGATKLTDAEARRHLATLDAWIQKADALGKEVPTDILKTRDALKRADDTTGDWKKTLGGLAGAFGVTFSVGAVIGFTKSLMDSADQIVRVSDRTGLMTTEVQKLQYIAGQSGNTLDELTGSIGQMQVRLASGDKGAIAAVRDLHLNLDTLRASTPYEQFEQIAGAIGKIENPAEQARLAMELFGKAGVAILPTIKSDLKALGDEAPVMSDRTARALERAGDAFGQFQATIKAFAANSYVWLGDQFDKMLASIIRKVAELANFIGTIASVAAKLPGGSVFAGLAASAKETATWLADTATALEQQGKTAEAVRPKLAALPPLIDRNTDANKGHAKAVKEVVALAPDVQHALDLIALAHQHEAAQLKFSESAWKAWESTVSKTLQNLPTSPVLLQGRDLSGLVPQIVAGMGSGVPPAARESLFHSIFGTSEEFGARMSSTIMGAIQGGGSVVGAAAGTLGQALTSHLAKTLTSGLGTAIKGSLGGAINAILPGLGSLLGPLADKLFSVIGGLFDRNKGRDVVQSFADSLGGFDALHRKLNELGAEGERLWIRLTQGVGRNKPEEAKAAVDAVTAALEQHARAAREAGEAATAAGEAESEAMRAAQAVVDEFNGRIQSLQQSIADEAPEEVMGLVEANTRAQIDALVKQRDAAQAAINDTTETAAEAARTSGDIIDAALAAREFQIRVKVNLDGLPGGGEGVIPMANGGDFWITRPTLFLAGEKGPERATFSPNGRVPPSAAAPAPQGDIYLTTQTVLDGRVLDERTERVVRRAAATGRVRPRATAGRSN